MLEDTMRKLMEKVENQLRPIADKSVLLINLGWESEGARRWLLKLVFTHLETYLVSANSYSFDNHYRHFASEVRNLPSDWNGKVNLSQVAVRKWKGFLLLSVVLAYRELHSAEALAADITMDEFQKKFSLKPDFVGISMEDWEVNRRMYNYMSTALRLVSPDGKELMIRECCALLCGITKCMQGSSTGRGVNRTKIIFEHLTRPPTPAYEDSELPSYSHLSSSQTVQSSITQSKSVIFEAHVMSIEQAITALKKWQPSAEDQASKTGLLRLYLTRPNRSASTRPVSPHSASDSSSTHSIGDEHSATDPQCKKRTVSHFKSGANGGSGEHADRHASTTVKVEDLGDNHLDVNKSIHDYDPEHGSLITDQLKRYRPNMDNGYVGVHPFEDETDDQ